MTEKLSVDIPSESTMQLYGVSMALLEETEKKMILDESKLMQFTNGSSRPKQHTSYVQDVRLMKQINKLKKILISKHPKSN